MSNISTLVNKGIQIIGAPRPESEKQRTVIVVGPARSGTSIVSGSLYHLGVFLGEKAVAPVFEDTVLADSYEKSNISELESLIQRYNAQHDIWSHKRPSILNDINTVYEKFRNPIFVFTFKDVLSIANRNSISAQLDLLDGLDRSLAEYQKILKFIRNKKPSAMLIVRK